MSSYMFHSQSSFIELLSNKAVTYFDVLGPLVERWILEGILTGDIEEPDQLPAGAKLVYNCTIKRMVLQ